MDKNSYMALVVTVLLQIQGLGRCWGIFSLNGGGGGEGRRTEIGESSRT